MLRGVNRFVSVPRDQLAALLQAAGSSLTPEEYLASLTEVSTQNRYRGRFQASVWSKSILLVAAILSGIWVCLPIGFSFEGILIAVALGLITFFEYRVSRYFHDLDPRAPSLGFRNQSAFAALLLFYGLYHAFLPAHLQMLEYNNLIDPDMMALVQSFTRIIYLMIGLVGGVSQFALAWYYRAAGEGPASI